MCSPDKPMFLKDTTPVHSHWQCDKMCSPVKPVIKLKASVHSNRDHFSWTLTSSVHRLNRCTSKRSSVDLQRLVQKLRKCTHQLNRLYQGGSTSLTSVITFSDSFFSNGYSTCCLYKCPNGSHSALSRIRTLHTYPGALRAPRASFIHLWSSQDIKNQAKAKRLRRSSFMHPFLVIGSCSSECQDLLLLLINST
jgi:hypothetical protein